MTATQFLNDTPEVIPIKSVVSRKETQPETPGSSSPSIVTMAAYATIIYLIYKVVRGDG